MASLEILSGTQIIRSVDDWFRLAPPRGKAWQWKDGRSAKEGAQVCFRGGEPAVPVEWNALFDKHPLTRGQSITIILPELETDFDDYPNGRVHDKVVYALGPAGFAVIGIEHKAAEPFGDRVGPFYDRMKNKPTSNVPARIDHLVSALFGRELDAEIRALKYQLFYAVAGTLVEAARASAKLAVFVVHEFVPDCKGMRTKRRGKTKRDDLADFVRTLSGDSELLIPTGDFLLGPFAVSGGGKVPAHIPLLIGRVTTLLPAGA